ncbi:hypothetical protein Godav_013093 [Gossypium davidsonii]|uniref:Cyanate lyase C-terminal domain-containing protein n=1 Tax=Gossypium davidsonii TaxID=34287 RepID=A0A7J8RF76_GOSDV|nr:hypothetical protein [Gossypium davidsonii]
MSTQLRLAFMFQMAEETGLANVYVAQLLKRQAQLNPQTLSTRASPLDEAVMHYGESIKEITNEEFGNGIMSATVFYRSADKVKGGDREDRVVATFDGKHMPYTEQRNTRLNLDSNGRNRSGGFKVDDYIEANE